MPRPAVWAYSNKLISKDLGKNEKQTSSSIRRFELFKGLKVKLHTAASHTQAVNVNSQSSHVDQIVQITCINR